MLTTRPGLIRKKILASVGEWRRKIIIESDIDEEDDQMREDEDDDDDGDKSLRKDRPSVKKTITDYGVEPHFSQPCNLLFTHKNIIIEIPYLNDEHAKAATRNSELKLLFRLCKFDVRNEEGVCVYCEFYLFLILTRDFL